MANQTGGSMWPLIFGVTSLSIPALLLRFSGTHLGIVPDTAIYGLAIISAAFLLAWAAEAAEVDISQGLAVAVVALIAVLPEYAVDMAFAWKAGEDPAYAPYAVANMTGGNRLLIGAAWPFLFFLFWLRARKSVLRLERGHAVEVVALTVATAYSFILPFKGEIALYDTVILASIFVVYVYIIAKAPTEELELNGPALSIGILPKRQRRTAIIGLMAYAATAIIASAEPFAEGMVHSGTQLGIDEFLLVQWLAPLASESPEFLFAGILAWRGRASVSMGALLSSKVNQWTLLIGGLPIAYSLSSGEVLALPMDARQSEEVLLTAAQSAFAVAVLITLSISAVEAGLLFGLFALQLFVPEWRLEVAYAYLVLAAVIVVLHRREIGPLLQMARTPHADIRHSGEPAEHGASAGH